jgi:hypothetical protein
VENYFNYFTEIEDHFQRRRGSILFLSTLDWALIDTWREAGIPLEAVLRGIDTAFDRYDARKRSTSRRVNGLAWCAQEVMTAAEDLREASIGSAKPQSDSASAGLEWDRIASHLTQAAAALRAAQLTGLAAQTASEIADRLNALAAPPVTAPTSKTSNATSLYSKRKSSTPSSPQPPKPISPPSANKAPRNSPPTAAGCRPCKFARLSSNSSTSACSKSTISHASASSI